MRRTSILVLATTLAAAIATGGVARAGENVVSKVTARADGGKTVIVVHGSATPSFTAYRLERPARVVVDVADGKIGAAELRDGPIDVDTWAVGQIAMAQYASDVSRTARLMIGFKRPASYDVKAVGHDLVITVLPDEPMPADALRADAAKIDEARKRRQEAEAQTAATEQRRQAAEQAEKSALARAMDAQREADAARTRAQSAKDELDRVVTARKAEEARLRETQSKSSTATAQHAEGEAQRAKLQAEVAAEEQRLTRLRAEAQALAAQRDAEAKKLSETQAAARKAAEEKQARLAELEQAARARQAASEAARADEERKAQQRIDEATRLAQAAATAQKARADEAARLAQAAAAAREAQAAGAARASEAQARASEAQAQAARTASREAENRAQQALLRARAAEEAARAEQEKLARLRSDAQKQADTQRAAQAELERARVELAKLTAAQEAERTRVEAARREAARVAAERAQAVERAEHAAALASGSLEKMAAAEREARRIADERAKESARLESVRREMQATADARQKELTKLEAARAEAKKIEEQRRAEEARLAQLRDDVKKQADVLAAKNDALARTSGELAAKSNALQAASNELAAKSTALSATASELARRNDQLSRADGELAAKSNALQATSSELAAKSSELQAKNDELGRKAEAARATQADLLRAKGDLARLQAELRQLDAERKAAAQRARSDEAKAVEQSAEERARLERERGELAAQLSAERAALTKKVQAAQAEMARVAGEQQKKAQALQSAEKELAAAQAEMKRLVAEQDKKRAEGAALDQQLATARAELARIEAETRRRLSMVPTPEGVKRSDGNAARGGEPATARMAAASAMKEKDAVPTEKLAPAARVARGEPAGSRIRDVRFADDSDAERVIVDVGDKETDAMVVRADERGAVLKIPRASLPKKLERTLDASAFAGPIRSVSTYADPDDAGAVRVEVALADGGPHAQPKLVRADGTLTWEFPRASSGTRILPPPKVAGYNASVPLQVAQAMPSSRAPRGRKVYSGRRMELDFVNADIHNIMRLISEVGQVNIVLGDDVKGTVTMHLRDVPWDQALDVIAKSKGLGVQREGNLIRIAPQAVLEKELEQEVARAKAAVELKPLETRLIPLSYADGQQILPRIQEVMSPRGHVSVDQRTNNLIVTDVAANIGLAEDLVNHLDTQTPQVLIEARIVEARTTFTRDIGIQWGGNSINSAATGNPTGAVFPSTVGVAGGATDSVTNTQGLQLGQSGAVSPNFAVNMPAAVGTGSGGALGVTLGSLNGAVNINLRLSSLENTGNVRIISAPKIMTLDNIEASIEQGVAIPISVVSAAGANTVFVDAKLNLTVKPHVTNEGSIVMNVNITRNEPDFVNVGARGDPTILKKQAKTEMLVRDGDTAVIGGIYTRNTGLSYTKVPWFADIPVIGWLFKNRRENDDRTELLIFITPRIVNRAVVAR